MKNVNILLVALSIIVTTSCQDKNMKTNKTDNPLLASKFDTPHESIPFDKILVSDYMPAVKKAIEIGNAEINEIVNNNEEANFDNTILALDNSGKELDIVTSVFFNLLNADANEAMQKLAQEISPIITQYSNDIMLNPKLFEKVKFVFKSKDKLNLNKEQALLLEDTYKGFTRSGALLEGADRDTYRELSTKLAQLSLKFDENSLKELNGFNLHITKDDDLAGLPDFVIEAAALEAKDRNLEGWVFTLQYPSYGPFMKYSENRELRKKMYMTRVSQCSGDSEFSNTNLITEIVNIRLQMANLFGYKSYADYVLEERMAGSADAVNSFLSELALASMPRAKQEVKELQDFAKQKGSNFELMSWDWSYYSELLKNEKYSINDALVKPYFQLENVEKSILDLAGTLYGLEFVKKTDIPLYHKDVITYEVNDANDSFIGLLYLDFFPRASKQSGAWMTSFKTQYKDKNGDHRPHITVVCNFTKPTENKPSLLTHGEVTTFLHEFGHALHGMLSDVSYRGQAGTSVARDFVELPSQLMENFAYEKEWLNQVAKHYETGETMSDSIIDKIVKAGKFQAGSSSARQLSLGMTDMAWHSITEPFSGDVVKFEQDVMDITRILPKVEGAATSPTFGHIFAGGYAAGYYGYKWAEVLDADAFASFKEEGIFNKETAKRFRKEILSKGGSRKEMESYIAFKGRKPQIDALLERSGLKK